jgi:CPA2 family monovalent cation:H+ antiporter-2
MEPSLPAHAPAFLSEIVALLAASAGIAYVGHRFRIMPIVSFLITGAIVGPHALALVRDEALIEAAAEIGVILLLFTIGIEFSLEKLGRIRKLIFVGGGLQVALVTLLVTGSLALLGVDWRTGVFTGCLVALSSTAIVMKLLTSRGDMNTQEGHAALGILIFQDLAVVAMVLMVPMLGGMGGSGRDIAMALGKAAGIIAVVLVAARRLMPPILEAVARTCSQEIFLLTVVGICLGTAYVTSLAGVSLSLGAFLAGLVVSESRFSHLAFGEILPLQILFSAMFFVSVGLLLDVGFLLTNPLLVLGVIIAVLVVKTVTAGIGLLAMGYHVVPAIGSAVILAQVGEFSFVLERTGRDANLFPAGVQEGGPETFIAATVALMIASPLMYRLGERMRRHAPTASTAEASTGRDQSADGPMELRDHVIVAGLGDTGWSLAQLLKERGQAYIILTLSPDGAREAERRAFRVLRGNYTRQHELELARIRSARVLVVADDHLETTRQVVASARALNPNMTILARTRRVDDASELRDAGANNVVSDDQEGLVRVVARVLESIGTGNDELTRLEERLRYQGTEGGDGNERHLRTARAGGTHSLNMSAEDLERAASRCSHLEATRDVVASIDGCEDCLNLGWTWVHLRICMSCGHVGCCDTSRGQHASAHFRTVGHPIVKSLEPGDGWVWCFEDKTFL